MVCCFLHGNLHIHTCITFVCIIAASCFYCSSGSCSSKVELMSPITNASFMESVLWNSLPIKIKEHRKNLVFNLDKKKHLQITKRKSFSCLSKIGLVKCLLFDQNIPTAPFSILIFFFFFLHYHNWICHFSSFIRIDFIFKNIFIA